MALSKEGLIQELKHEIHSPLAAIRNALYLAAIRTDDPETQRYLVLADAELVRYRRSPEKCRSNRRKQTVSSAYSIPGCGFRCIRFTSWEQKSHDFLSFHAQSLLHLFQTQLRIHLCAGKPAGAY